MPPLLRRISCRTRPSSRPRSCAPARPRPVELVEASLAAIERVKSATSSAFITLRPDEALAEADRMPTGDPAAAVRRADRRQGLPHRGHRRAAPRTAAAFGDSIADHDTRTCAACARRARSWSGKTNAPELAMRPVTENTRFGPTRNPWDPRAVGRRLVWRERRGGRRRAWSRCATAAIWAARSASRPSCCGVVGPAGRAVGRVSIGPDFGRRRPAGKASTARSGAPCSTRRSRSTRCPAYEPGDHHWLSPPRSRSREAARRDPERLEVHVALGAPLGMPVEPEPRDAARAAADALAALGHDVRERLPIGTTRRCRPRGRPARRA